MHKVELIHNILRIPEEDWSYLYYRIGKTVIEVTGEKTSDLLEEEVKREIDPNILPPFAFGLTTRKVVRNNKLKTCLSRNGLELVSKQSE